MTAHWKSILHLKHIIKKVILLCVCLIIVLLFTTALYLLAEAFMQSDVFQMNVTEEQSGGWDSS